MQAASQQKGERQLGAGGLATKGGRRPFPRPLCKCDPRGANERLFVLPKSIGKRSNQYWAAARKSAPDEAPLQLLNPHT